MLPAATNQTGAHTILKLLLRSTTPHIESASHATTSGCCLRGRELVAVEGTKPGLPPFPPPVVPHQGLLVAGLSLRFAPPPPSVRMMHARQGADLVRAEVGKLPCKNQCSACRAAFLLSSSTRNGKQKQRVPTCQERVWKHLDTHLLLPLTNIPASNPTQGSGWQSSCHGDGKILAN